MLGPAEFLLLIIGFAAVHSLRPLVRICSAAHPIHVDLVFHYVLQDANQFGSDTASSIRYHLT